MLTKDEILSMENEKLISEICLFQKIKKIQIKKKYANITDWELLKKLNRATHYKFGDKRRKLVKEMVENGISKMQGFREV